MNKKSLVLNISNLDTVKLEASGIDSDFLRELKEKGISLDPKNFEGLSKKTIDSCHSLIRDKGLGSVTPDTKDTIFELIGEYLYSILLQSVGKQLNESLFDTDAEVELVLRFKADANLIAAMPWELIYCPKEQDLNEDGFYFSKKINLYRQLQLNEKSIVPSNALRVLFFLAPCNNIPAETLKGIGQTLQAIKNQHNNFVFSLIEPFDHLGKPQATFDNFKTAIKRFKPNVIHFIGETDFDGQQEAQFHFYKNDKNETQRIAFNDGNKRLKEFLQSTLLNKNHLNLFIAQTWNDEFNRSFKGLHQISNFLLNIGVPASIAMPYCLNNNNRLDFLHTFYTNILEEETIGSAVKAVRNELYQNGVYGFPMLLINQFDNILCTSAVYQNQIGTQNLMQAKESPTDTYSSNANFSSRNEDPSRPPQMNSRAAENTGTANFDFSINSPSRPSINAKQLEWNQLDKRLRKKLKELEFYLEEYDIEKRFSTQQRIEKVKQEIAQLKKEKKDLEL